MQKTANFNLNQWEANDPICRADFNSDNAAIDGALAQANADLAAVLAAVGSGGENCRIAWGTYVGDGQSGHADNGNTATSIVTGFRPVMFCIAGSTSARNGVYSFWETAAKKQISYEAYLNASNTKTVTFSERITWEEDRITFRCDGSYMSVKESNSSDDYLEAGTLYCAASQFNKAGTTYSWLAIGYDE